MLFAIISCCDKGELEVDSFVHGVQRLSGFAKAQSHASTSLKLSPSSDTMREKSHMPLQTQWSYVLFDIQHYS
eukprot:2499835-Amphidinium_carterae.1